MTGARSELVVGGFAAHVFVDDLGDDLETLSLREDDAHHLFTVRRLRAGERVSAGDGAGRWRPCVVEAGRLSADGPVVVEPPPSPEIAVGFAVVKGERPEAVVQKLTEAGVDRVIPLVTERSVVRWSATEAERHHGKLERVARVAAMQCRRAWLPAVSPVTAFTALIEEFAQAGGVGAGDRAGGVALAAAGGVPLSLAWPTVLVGPEGGWSPSELNVALPQVALGEFVYRSETAAVIAGGLLAALRADLVAECVTESVVEPVTGSVRESGAEPVAKLTERAYPESRRGSGG